MFKKMVALVMSATLVVSGLTVTTKEVEAAVHSSSGSGNWNLVWSDEFNQDAGSAPNSENWQYDIGHGSDGWGNQELQYYTDSTSNVAISNVDGATDGKALQITAKRENGQITSGRIKSLDKQYVKYGKIEARLKTSNGMQPGVWPAFWMMGNDIHTNGMGWPLCGEIDIMEHRNAERNIISTLHWNKNADGSYSHDYLGSEKNNQYGYVDSMDDWHTYAVEWYEDCMKFFLDGNCYETIALTDEMKEEFHKPHFILLNLAIGSTNTPFTLRTTVTDDWQTSSLYVDYVRVYQGDDASFYRAKSSDTSNIPTTASPTAGMTPCAVDAWTSAGDVWDYNMSNSWAQASGYYAGGSQNDFSIYVSNPSLYEWGAMIRARQGVTPGHSYNYTINYNSTKAGSVLVKEDVSGAGEQTVGLVEGNGTITGSFTAGDAQSEAQILMDLRGVTAGTKITITGLSLTDTTQSGGEPATTTTQAAGGSTVKDWSSIAYAGNGSGDAANDNKYKFYCDNTNVSLVNIQKPGFASEAGLYVTFPAGISSCSLGSGNYDIQGAGIILHLSAFTAKETQFTVTDAQGTYTCYVYYENGTGSGETEIPTEAPTVAPGEEITASAYVRTVHVNTNGAAISADEKVDADIVIMDKIGGDAYEDSVVYDTISQPGTIKVRGNSTANADKKPYNISFDSKQEVFGMGKAKKWSLLANAFDKSLIRNRLAMEFATDLGLAYTSESTYVDLYVNGEYYGNYLLIESIEAGSDRVDIDTDNESDILLERERDRSEDGVSYITTSKYGIRFAVGEPEDIDTASAHFTNTVQKLNDFETALESNDIDAISQYIDVDSFVNFYIVNELFKNVDFNFSSTRFYIKDGKIYAGPLWDLDLSSGNASSSYYLDYYEDGVSYKGLWCQSFTWFRVLMENETFKEKVADRYNEVQPLITNMVTGNTGNSIDALTSTYAEAFAKNYTPKAQGGAGWTIQGADSADPYSYSGESGWTTYTEATTFLRNWLSSRNSYLLEEFSKVSLGSVTADSVEIDGITYDNMIKSTGVTATASSSENDDLGADKAIDGNEATRWASSQADNQTLVIDLGKECNVKAFSILWEAASAASYAIKTSTDGTNYNEVATYTSSAGARKDDIVLDEEVTARYILIDCYTRTTAYGFSIYELAVWGSEAEAVIISDDIEINGFQISTLVEGIRTVYSVDSKVEGQDVTEVGLIYGLEKDGFAEKDMVAGSTNYYVCQVAGTEEKGKLDKVFSKSASYAMTMEFGGDNAMAYNAVYKVRAYAKLADGTVVYSNIDRYTVYDVADELYQKKLMSTAVGHEYLYDKILYPLNNDYKKVEYDWSSIVAPADL